MESESLLKPSYITDLEQAFGGPSQAAFGSAVFFEPDADAGRLEEIALATYQHFCGETWTRFGADKWLEHWVQVYARETESTRDIVAELGSLDDQPR